MEPGSLIAALSDPAAYSHRPERVEVRQTHISVVFLAGPFVYKIKKPLRLAFLDYGTLARRRYCCEEEVRLNRRLAPGVYLGVVPITAEGAGLKVDGTGAVVEWAVRMQRLPEEATLQAMLGRGDVDPGLVAELGRRLAGFHLAAERSSRILELSRWENLERMIEENHAEAAREIGSTVSAGVHGRIGNLLSDALRQLRPRIESRWSRGLPCDTHGDLRPEHVYFLPDRTPPGDITIVDAVEFNEAFRAADPALDMAFLVMELTAQGRPDLARGFQDAYVSASADHELPVLLPLFVAHRAVVRAKVGGLKWTAPEIPEAERQRARDRARGHWLAALGALEEPGRRPCLVLVVGLPGSGKSTLSRGLASSGNFQVVRTDQIRKEIARAAPGAAAGGHNQGIYTPEWTDLVYRRCLERTENFLFEGQRVIVDATFRTEAWRQAFLELAGRYAVPAVLLHCQADEQVVRTRLAARRDDLSDADEAVYRRIARDWEPFSCGSLRKGFVIHTGGETATSLGQAQAHLHALGLLE